MLSGGKIESLSLFVELIQKVKSLSLFDLYDEDAFVKRFS